MRFDRVRLRNFKPYEDADLRLDRGVSVVLGPNGSGKSSLLEACFFALYGSKALDDVNLVDLITRGEDEAEIELWFTHDGDAYHVRRRLRATDDRARTAECVLETPDGPVEGATNVRTRVVEMVRMDADAFVNCAYVRQGEVNKLIHATPSERQDMIDDLLQLGRLETYRERASEARLGVDDLVESQREVADNLAEQIEEKEDRDLPARLNDLESQRNEVEAQIERFEENREQARETRDEAQAVLDRHEEAREELEEIAETVEDLRETVAETEGERDDLQETIAEARERREDRESERATLLDGLDAATLRPDPDLFGPVEGDDGTDAADGVDLPDAETLAPGSDADPAAVEAALAALETVADAVADRLNEAEVRERELSNERDRLRERAEERESEAESKRAEAEDLAEEVTTARETLAERRERLESLDDAIADIEERFADAPVEPDGVEEHLEDLEAEREAAAETLADLRAERDRLADRIEEAERLLEAGKCPECGQPVEDSPHVDRLAEDRERHANLEDEVSDQEATVEDVEERVAAAEELREAARELDRRRDTRGDVEQLIEEKAASVADDEERVERLREEATEREEAAAELREQAAELAASLSAVEERVSALETARERLHEGIERVERVVEVDERVASLDEEIERAQAERERLAELNDERRERLADLRERREALREEFDEETVETAREERDRAVDYLDDVTEKLEELAERRDELREQIGAVNAELEQLEELRERRETVTAKLSALSSLHDEVSSLETTYGDLRADLRRRNVEVLERMLNDTFDLVYGGDSYAGIDLGADYELTVFQKDGEPLDPEQLSGGERALFNLSLRCAIYRLLAEGVEGTAPLPPLILDEPTVFLDSEHVSRLVDLVEEMRDLGVEQIVVVTHDEELVGAADSVVRVRKDATTNRSTVTRDDAGAVAVDGPPAE